MVGLALSVFMVLMGLLMAKFIGGGAAKAFRSYVDPRLEKKNKLLDESKNGSVC